MKESDRYPKDDATKNTAITDQYVYLVTSADFGASFIISGILAAVFKTSIAPLERIKLILQTQASSYQITRKTAYSGFLDAIIRIPREQGFFSLWRGNFLNICRYFPTQAINFSVYDIFYDTFTRVLDPKTVHSRSMVPFMAGGAVGMTSCVLLYPLTFCTTRISVDVGDSKRIKREFRSLSDCLYKVYKTDGFRGFYQGISCSAIGICLYRSAYFGIYTTGKRAYLHDYSFDSKSRLVHAPFLVSLIFAQLASTVSTIIAYPFDTIARQKMLWSGRGRDRHVTLRDVIGRIIKKEGPVGFYRGVFANFLTTVCGSFLLVTYDIIKDFYERSKRTKGINLTVC